MSIRKYPHNHASNPESSNLASRDAILNDVDCRFIDELSKKGKMIVAGIDALVSNLKADHQPEPTVSPDKPRIASTTQPEVALTNDKMDEIVAATLYVGPGFTEEKQDEPAVSKLPLYAGPEDLVFGESFSEVKKTNEKHSSPSTVHDHFVIYG